MRKGPIGGRRVGRLLIEDREGGAEEGGQEGRVGSRGRRGRVGCASDGS